MKWKSPMWNSIRGELIISWPPNNNTWNIITENKELLIKEVSLIAYTQHINMTTGQIWAVSYNCKVKMAPAKTLADAAVQS